MAEAKTGMKYRQEHEKEENFTPELVPESIPVKPVIETRAKIAETFNTKPRYRLKPLTVKRKRGKFASNLL